MSESDRRPIATRDARWAQRLSARLAAAGFSPNGISTVSALFALLGGLSLWRAAYLHPVGASCAYLFGALCIQGRLLCNLLDGMVAIEGGKKTPAGAIFNELPDRISDTAFFLGAGYGVGGEWGPTLGLAAALAAMSTAYVRLLGVSAGVAHDFCGPMAKQHRMAILTLACVCAAVLCHFESGRSVLCAALALITLGSLLTALRRTLRIVRKLDALA